MCPKMMAARAPRIPTPPRAMTWGGIVVDCGGAGCGAGAAAGACPGMREVTLEVMSFRLMPICGPKEFRNPRSNIVRAIQEL